MKTIAYYRVSTQKQGQSGLGLEAQKQTVREYLKGESLIAEYREVESGRMANRPVLKEALEHAKRARCRLVIAKVDRLARNTRFLLNILDSGVDIVFCDLPSVDGPASRMMLTMLAGFAEFESKIISDRTKKALAAAKARGVKLGAAKGKSPLEKFNREHGNKFGVGGIKRAADRRAESWRSTITALVADGLSNNAIARTLTARGEPSLRGGTWTSKAVSRLRARLATMTPAPSFEMG